MENVDLTPESVAEVFLLQEGRHTDEDFWAWEYVHELIRSDAVKGWEITRLLLHAATSDHALAYVAAGPFEELLQIHGAAIFDDLEEESRKHARIRLALSGVWLDPSYTIYPRWFELLNKYGFLDGRKSAL